jgi:hypothetical protein
VPVAEMWREEVHIRFWWGNLREELKGIGVDWIGHQAVETKIIQNCNKTNSDLSLRNMGIERNHNSEIISHLEETLMKNISSHK